jgi:hypothetical protein
VLAKSEVSTVPQCTTWRSDGGQDDNVLYLCVAVAVFGRVLSAALPSFYLYVCMYVFI